MAVFGGWLLLGPARIVKTITAFPTKSPSPSQPAALKIEVELRKMLPLPIMPARVITTTPSELTLNYPLYTPVSITQRLTTAQRIQKRRLEEEERKVEQSKILSAPFRHASRAFYKLFKAIARTWSREGFLKLGIKGQIYKLDITGGWALDEGKALDRLVKVQRK